MILAMLITSSKVMLPLCLTADEIDNLNNSSVELKITQLTVLLLLAVSGWLLKGLDNQR